MVLLCPPHFQWGGYSIALVLTYLHPIHMQNGFRAISFENIGILDSDFIHMHIIIKYRF